MNCMKRHSTSLPCGNLVDGLPQRLWKTQVPWGSGFPEISKKIKFSISLSFSAGPSLPGLAIVSVWQSCGKPSTKFPHGGLVECLYFPNLLYNPYLKLRNFEKFRYFSWKSSYFRNRPVKWNPMDLALALPRLHFVTCIWIFNIFRTRNPVRSHQGDNAKLG